MEMRELRKYIERRHLPRQSLRDQFDASMQSVTEKMGSTIKMPNELGSMYSFPAKSASIQVDKADPLAYSVENVAAPFAPASLIAFG